MWHCVECGKVADNSKAWWQLKSHVEIHLVGVHSCTVCDHNSTTSAALKQHMYKTHKQEMQNLKEAAVKYKCNFCGKGSRTKIGLRIHKYKNRKTEKKTKAKYDAFMNKPTTDQEWQERVYAMFEKKGDLWRCVKCWKIIDDPKDWWNLEAHVKNHLEEMHNCTICGHNSTTHAGLSQHRYINHQQEMQIVRGAYKCNICESGSRTSYGLKINKYKNHKNEPKRLDRKFKCEVCGKNS